MENFVLCNANILTMDPAFPVASCVVIHDQKILTVTTADPFPKFKSKSGRYIDCRGKTIVPGFIDAHCHLTAFAESLMTLNLSPRNQIKAIPDIQNLIDRAAQCLQPGEWIRGGGYDEFSLVEKRHPNRRDLDEVAPVHPVKLTHRSGHAHVLNSLALKKIGISGESPEPPGGFIERDFSTGEPTGLLFGMTEFLKKFVPPMKAGQLEKGMKNVNQRLLSLGITSIQDASPSNNLERFERIRKWKEAGILKPRITMMLGWDAFKEICRDNFFPPPNEESLRFGAVKIMVEETTGQLYPQQSDLNEMIKEIHEGNSQAALHVMEIRSIEAASTAIELALRSSPKPDHRHRLEHCSLCPPELAKRLAALGVTVVTMPAFLYYHGSRYLRTIPPEDLPFLYPLGTLKKCGILVAAGSDSPIAPINPFIGIYAATSRRADTGEVVGEDERIDILEALKLYTIQAAQASFEEKIKGSISPGKMADLVVLNEDPTRLPSDRIKELQAEMTILGGELVWERDPKR